MKHKVQLQKIDKNGNPVLDKNGNEIIITRSEVGVNMMKKNVKLFSQFRVLTQATERPKVVNQEETPHGPGPTPEPGSGSGSGSNSSGETIFEEYTDHTVEELLDQHHNTGKKIIPTIKDLEFLRAWNDLETRNSVLTVIENRIEELKKQ